MGCNCGKKGTSHQVVLADGKVAFTSTSKTAAESVAKRYPGSTVRQVQPGNTNAPKVD